LEGGDDEEEVEEDSQAGPAAAGFAALGLDDDEGCTPSSLSSEEEDAAPAGTVSRWVCFFCTGARRERARRETDGDGPMERAARALLSDPALSRFAAPASYQPRHLPHPLSLSLSLSLPSL
jgi:hypothetical protein